MLSLETETQRWEEQLLSKLGAQSKKSLWLSLVTHWKPLSPAAASGQPVVSCRPIQNRPVEFSNRIKRTSWDTDERTVIKWP